MQRHFTAVAIECVADLGITLIYAIVVGILIACVAATEGGATAFARTGLYALALPAGVATLIVAEIGLRLVREWQRDRPLPVR